MDRQHAGPRNRHHHHRSARQRHAPHGPPARDHPADGAHAPAGVGGRHSAGRRPPEIIPLTARMRLPELVGAILLGGVFAKVISTANNYLFSPASNLIHDVYKRFIDPQASERRTLFVSRALVIALGAFALLQAAYFESVLKAALYAYTVYGAAVTPSVMAVFFWKRANKAGAISSIVLGTVITVAWNILNIQWPAVYPALGVSLLALIVVSLATAPPTRANLEPFEKLTSRPFRKNCKNRSWTGGCSSTTIGAIRWRIASWAFSPRRMSRGAGITGFRRRASRAVWCIALSRAAWTPCPAIRSATRVRASRPAGCARSWAARGAWPCNIRRCAPSLMWPWGTQARWSLGAASAWKL